MKNSLFKLLLAFSLSLISIVNHIEAQEFEGRCDHCELGCPCGLQPHFELLPACAPLFRPFAADPRQVTYSVGWRFGDQLFNPHTAPVSFGNHVAFFRINNPWGCPGALQLELEGGVWALFEHCDHIAPLDNADYYVGLPLVYCHGSWKHRLRLWHLSSHLGDEFMVEHPQFVRTNPSAEYLDYFLSYEPSPCLRLYGGLGVILRSDETHPCKRFYAEYGGEWRYRWGNICFPCSRIHGRPFFACHFRSYEDNNFDFDGTFVAGYEFTKCAGCYKRLRIFGEYHNGFSVEGQFNRLHTDYFALRLSYGY